MKIDVLWNDQVPAREKQKNSINDLCFSPDGLHVVIAVGNRILLYNVLEGDLLHSLRGHKDTVYSVDYSEDGERFASAGADKTVIIWTKQGEGILKYTHTDSVQRVCYNPRIHMLASCTGIDFGLWSQEQKSVNKQKVHSKILSACWNRSGIYLALGFIDGVISMRDINGMELQAFSRDSAVYSLCWNRFSSCREELRDIYDENIDSETLAVGCWDQTLSFYDTNGNVKYKERKLGFYPCNVSYSCEGEYILVSGSNRQVTVFSKEGIKLDSLCAPKEGWIWASKMKHQGYNNEFDSILAAIGCDDGSIEVLSIKLQNIYSINQDWFIQRRGLTSILVKHINNEMYACIKCKDFIRGLALNREYVAIQFTHRIHIYELNLQENSSNVHYRLVERLNVPYFLDTGLPQEEPSKILLLSRHIIICRGNMMQQLTMKGHKEFEWIFDDTITFAKALWRISGEETLLVGLRNGSILQVMVNSTFSIELTKVKAAVAYCDISMNRKNIAVLDVNCCLSCLNVVSKVFEFVVEEVESIAFNSEVEDLLCYTLKDEDFICIKSQNLDPYRQKFYGTVLAFSGKMVYSLNSGQMKTTLISPRSFVYLHINSKNFEFALQFSKFGATQGDWRILAVSALQQLKLDIAQEALKRLKEFTLIEFVNELSSRQVAVSKSNNSQSEASMLQCAMMGEIMARLHRYKDAARVWINGGMLSMAIALFTDLKQWDKAKEIAISGNTNTGELVRQQAKWAEETNDWRLAANMYTDAGDYNRASEIVCSKGGERNNSNEGWQQILMQICRLAAGTDQIVLQRAKVSFLASKEYDFAIETMKKMNDFEGLIDVCIEKKDWITALKVNEDNSGKFDTKLFFPYAEFLTDSGDYIGAIKAYNKAERSDMSKNLLQILIENSVTLKNYKDAAYFHFLYAKEFLSKEELKEDDKLTFEECKKHNKLADIYYAFDLIQSYTTDPFTSTEPEILFQASLFLVNILDGNDLPCGVSIVQIFYTLAKHAKKLGALKLALNVLERLQKFKISSKWREQVQLDLLDVGSQPLVDDPDAYPICYRCGNSDEYLDSKLNLNLCEDRCATCKHVFVRSILSFDILPLVRFEPEDSIDDSEALQLIRSRSNMKNTSLQSANEKRLFFENSRDHESIEFKVNHGENPSTELFHASINRTLEKQDQLGTYLNIKVDKETLQHMNRRYIYYMQPTGGNGRGSFYYNMMSEIAVSLSPSCNRFFHEDELEFAYLKDMACPFSRIANIDECSHC